MFSDAPDGSGPRLNSLLEERTAGNNSGTFACAGSDGGPTEAATNVVVPVHCASGAPFFYFTSCDAPTSAARAEPINAVALAAPRLLPQPPPRTLCGDSTVADFADFKARFETITGGAFSAFDDEDWANSVVAGGAVVLALTPMAPVAALLQEGDVDVFFYGLDADAARRKIEHLFALFQSAAPSALALRTPHTITVVLPAPMRVVQFILNLHDTPADVVSAFDVDVCGCFYDGQNVYATRRCARAFATRVNLAVPTRRSYSYESRLVKYALRGFVIGVPGLKAADLWIETPDGVYHGDVDLLYGQAADDDTFAMQYYRKTAGVLKLIFAHLAGREALEFASNFAAYLPKTSNTHDIALRLMRKGESYENGESYVRPSGGTDASREYAVAESVFKFTRSAQTDAFFCDFVIGGIKKGAAAGFDESTFFDGCYASVA